MVLGQGTEGLGTLEEKGNVMNIADVRIRFDGVRIIEVERVVPMIGIGNEEHREGNYSKGKEKEILFFVHSFKINGGNDIEFGIL